MENKYCDQFIVRTQHWEHADSTFSYSVFIMHKLGYSFVEAYIDEDGVFIGNLSVDPQHQRQGLADTTLDVIKDYVYNYDNLPKMVEVEHNSPYWMVEWYKRRGYHIIDRHI